MLKSINLVKSVAGTSTLLLATLLPVLLPLSVSAEPVMEIVEPIFNFGKVSQQVTVNHTYWIKSVGDDTLFITHVDPGCGCTKAPLRDTALAPGDSTRLDVFFSTRRFKGHVVKRPSVISNASEDKVFLQFLAEPMASAEAVRPVTVTPFKIDVSQFTTAVRRKSLFKLINRGDQDYKVNLIEVASPFFDVELPDMVPANDTVIGRVIVHEDAIEKEFQGCFTFEIMDDGRSRFTLPVRRMYRIKDKFTTDSI